jgi:hypothetical protein
LVVAVSVADFLLEPYTFGVAINSAADLRLTVGQSLLTCTYAVNAALLLVALPLARPVKYRPNGLPAPLSDNRGGPVSS